MKKYFLFIAILVISIIAIFSCRKSIEPEVNTGQVMTTSSETELKIQAFLERLNSNLKEETTYSIEDAIWYAEATLNYTYSIYDSSFAFLSRESSTFSIDLNQNNTVNQSDLVAAYLDMVDSLAAHFDYIQTNPKHVLICDVTNAGVSGSYLHIELISVIAYDFIANQYGSFGPTDYWYAGQLAGKCDDYKPANNGQDATTELKYKLLHPIISSDPFVRIYYIDFDMISDIDPEDYPFESAPRGTRGYWYGSQNPNDVVQCLQPDELNFYLSSNGIPYIIEDNDNFPEKEFCYIDIKYLLIPSIWYYYEAHWYHITYGVRQETSVPASEL
jgi:hypothetical protein